MEGQVRGVARMIERDEDCVDVLQQTAALRAAVDSVTMLLMEDHVHGCVNSAVKSGDADALTDEVMEVVRRGMGRPVAHQPDQLRVLTGAEGRRRADAVGYTVHGVDRPRAGPYPPCGPRLSTSVPGRTTIRG